MGDMADWIVDNFVIDDWGEQEDGITCKYCGDNYLHWRNIGTNKDPVWRLFNEHGERHKCDQYKEE